MRFCVFILGLLTLFYSGCVQESREAPVIKVHNYVSDGIDSLNKWIEDDFIYTIKNNPDSNLLRQHFFRGRELYKGIEFAIEYFFTNAARNINGPPLPEIEPEEHMVLDPGGFQVIEEHLFPFDANS